MPMLMYVMLMYGEFGCVGGLWFVGVFFLFSQAPVYCYTFIMPSAICIIIRR